MQLHVGSKPEKNMQSWYEGIGPLFLFRSVWKPELLENVWRKSVMHHLWYNQVHKLFSDVLLDLWFHKEATNNRSYSTDFDIKQQCSVIEITLVCMPSLSPWIFEFNYDVFVHFLVELEFCVPTWMHQTSRVYHTMYINWIHKKIRMFFL